MTKVRCLIIDDHPTMRRGLRDTLRDASDLEICGEAGDFDEAMTLLRTSRPRVVLLDVSLPGGSGFELARQMLHAVPDLKILVVSMHDDSLYAERALRAGALGYINKAQPAAELLNAVRTVARGEIALNQTLAAEFIRRGLRPGSGPGERLDSLSDRELEIFELIGQGLGLRAIAEKLCISTKTVDSHREHIKTKLGVSSGAELVRHAILWTERA